MSDSAIDNPYTLLYWKPQIIVLLRQWLESEAYRNQISKTVMTGESLGPFTKFLYHIGSELQAPWGVIVDFNERSQKVFITNRFYKWVHKLRDELQDELSGIPAPNQLTLPLKP